jgi:hypothetical protein
MHEDIFQDAQTSHSPFEDKNQSVSDDESAIKSMTQSPSDASASTAL